MNKEDFKTYIKDTGCQELVDRVTPEMMDWLEYSGFFTAPASTKYHGAYVGGLWRHSSLVASFLLDYTEKLNLLWKEKSSPWIIGLFHDLCKVDNYISVDPMESDGHKWEYNSKQFLKGHGEKSVMLLSQFMILTEEEVLCIRYHMGAYVKEDWDEFDRAIRKYSNVLYTHTADMLASKVFNV